jgi:DNA adenine methylase
MVLSSPFCRVGSKRPLKDVIKKHAPKDFDTYVEPFVGAGHIYFHLTSPAIKSYLNDKDKMVADGYKLLKSNIPITDIERFKTMSPENINAFVKTSHNKPIDKLAKIIYLQCGTFGSVGKTGAKLYKFPIIEPKLRKIPKFSEFMKNTTVTNSDYKALLKRDSPRTFFFFDPPYEQSRGLYKDSAVDYNDMARRLKNLKGKFILSINDSPEIRDTFKDFNMIQLTVTGGGKKGVGVGSRKELLIKNY